MYNTHKNIVPWFVPTATNLQAASTSKQLIFNKITIHSYMCLNHAIKKIFLIAYITFTGTLIMNVTCTSSSA